MNALSHSLLTFWDLWSPNLLLDVGRYVVAAGLMALILKVFWSGLNRRKIQTRSATAADMRREIFTSLRTGVVFSLVGVVVAVGSMRGVFTLYMQLQPRGMGYLLATLAAMIVAHDMYFYWTHRLMHHPRLFRYFHRTHHKSMTPTPFAAYAFDIPEALVMGVFTPLWLLLVPMHVAGLLAFMGFMIVRNVMGHAGVELMPRRLADSCWFGWINATTHHDLHHATFNYNYGLYFTWWDRLMGTEHPAYRERLRGKPQTKTVRQASIAAWPAKIGLTLVIVATLIFAAANRAQASEPETSIVGHWLTQSGNGVVEVYRCATQFCGRLVWFKPTARIVATSALDGKNPDRTQRQRPLCELVMLGDLKRRDANHWDSGWIYSPDSGRTYRATFTLENESVLKVRGYVDVPMFGVKQSWTRAWTRDDQHPASCREG